MTLEQLSKMLEEASLRCEAELQLDLLKIGEMTKTMATEYIGHEMNEWPALAASTVKEKEKLGYVNQVSATDPLLREGDMRDSIQVEQADLVVAVGSADKVALYQEMGTKHMPPRPFLGLAMRNSILEALDLLGETAKRLLSPGSYLK